MTNMTIRLALELTFSSVGAAVGGPCRAQAPSTTSAAPIPMMCRIRLVNVAAPVSQSTLPFLSTMNVRWPSLID
jgi:hypothetical protein